MTLPEGKIPLRVLEPILKQMPRGELLSKSRMGMDTGIVRLRGKYLLFASGCKRGRNLEELIPEIASKISKSGARLQLINPVVLFPPGTNVKEVRRTLARITNKARELGMTVGKGHTEITPGLDQPTLVLTIFGSITAPKKRQRVSKP